MKAFQTIAASGVLWIAALAPLAGCSSWGHKKVPTPPLGTQNDCIWRRQEAGAAASDFVMYQNEFEPNDELSDNSDDGRPKRDGARLNMAGEDHLRSIAARLHDGACMPVVVERSMTSERSDSEYKYPVNPNPELDMKRRDVVVKSLMALGIVNAEQCVVVAPAMAEGYTATEAVRAYNRGLSDTNARTGYSGWSGNMGAGAGGF
jgi:hypothetical protein